jgi:hypothetical protein
MTNEEEELAELDKEIRELTEEWVLHVNEERLITELEKKYPQEQPLDFVKLLSLLEPVHDE